MLNKANLITLRTAIDASESFAMARVRHLCGTPACIKGHFEAVFDRGSCMLTTLGLTRKQADAIVTPLDDRNDWGAAHYESTFIDKQVAVAMLSRLINTGEVDWNQARADVEDNTEWSL